MRIVFFGASDVGYQCCKRLLEQGQEVVAIFSIPQKFQISYSPEPVSNVMFRSFEDLAERYGIPLRYVAGGNDPACRSAIADARPDFGLAVGWYYLIPKAVRQLFPLGVAGVHASLLPRYRGGAPLVWAIINGETRTGVTLFYMDGGVDTGDVIAQREIEVDLEDTIQDLYGKATEVSVEMVDEMIPLIATGEAPRIPQDESQATVYPQRRPEDGRIDWSQSCEQIRNFVRAQTRPYPGAFTVIEGKKIILWDAEIIDLKNE